MANYDYPPINRGEEDTQQRTDGNWEEKLTLLVNQAEPRELSLWLLGCLRHVVSPASIHLLDEMIQWYAQADEKLRWQIFHHAEALGFETPAGALALSLFWSQGSMSPEGLEPVYPEPHLSAEMRRCVLIMLATHDTDNPADRVHQLLTQWANKEKS